MNLFKALPIAVCVILTCFTSGAQQSYINGNLITGNTLNDGTPAPAGAFWSEIQPPNNTLGYISNTDVRKSLLDDFTIPQGSYWNISSFVCYSHITNYFGSANPFDSLMIRIYDTDPMVPGATPLWGNLSTNRLSGGAFSNIYRTKFNVFDASRKIWEIKGQIDTILGGGHYWIEWIVGKIPPTLSNSFPLNTITGSTGTPGSNALLRDLNSGSFTTLTDAGSQQAQDLPFKLFYDSILPNPCSGTPQPGETLSDKYYVCPGETFQLFIRDTPLVTGSAYQWEFSADSLSWTDATGAVLSEFDTSQLMPMYYRCKVSCGSNVAYSVPLKIKKHFLEISRQPGALSAACANEASTHIECQSSSTILSYQWQWSGNTTGQWHDLKDGTTVKGALDDSLALQQLADSLNGSSIRVEVKDVCGNEYISDSVTVQLSRLSGKIRPDSSISCEKAQLLKWEGRNTSVRKFPSRQQPTPVSIPDMAAAGISDTIFISNLPPSASIKAITVKLNMDHPSARDLAITLKSPNGRVINLLYYMNRGDSSLSVPGFNGTYISSNASRPISQGVSTFNDIYKADLADNKERLGLPSGPTPLLPNTIRWEDLFTSGNGNWILGIYDGRTGNTGKLLDWQLSITCDADIEGYWSSSSAVALFKDSTAAVAYDISEATNSLFAKPDSTASITGITSAQHCNLLQASDTVFVRIQKRIVPKFDSIPPICPGDPLSLPDISTNGISGAWSPVPDNRNTQTYTFLPDDQPGFCFDQISLTVTVIDSCLAFGSDLIIYPNPVSGTEATIKFSRNAGEGPFNIFMLDASGRRVWGKTIVGQSTVTIPTANFSEGTYYLKIQSQTGTKPITGRLIILHP
jgi:subtilisin-like proprotein convertase family protein